MSSLNFLIKGMNGVTMPFSTYSNPRIKYSGYVDNFQGNVEILKSDDTTKTMQIDNVFTVTTVADNVIVKGRSEWDKLQKNCNTIFVATLIGGLAAVTVAVSLGVIGSSLLIPAIAVGVVALLIFAVSFLAKKRSVEARKEYNNWVDLTDSIIERCKNKNYYLVAEDKMKSKIEGAIKRKCPEIEELQKSKSCPQVLIQDKLKDLAFNIHIIWRNDSIDARHFSGMSISKEKVFEILNLHKTEYPLLEEVIKKIKET